MIPKILIGVLFGGVAGFALELSYAKRRKFFSPHL